MNRRTSLILNQVQSTLIQKHYSKSTIKSYSDWIYRFLFFFESENVPDFGEKQVRQFIKFLGDECFMAPSTLNQAQNAVLILYKDVWGIPVGNYSIGAKHSKQKPTVLNRMEIKNILSILKGEKWLMTSLMYGCGLTAGECVQLRIKNIDFAARIIKVKNENCTRQSLFPRSLLLPVRNQIEKVKAIYNENISIENYAGVLSSKQQLTENIKTSKKFKEHFLFPSTSLRFYSKSGILIQYSLSESYLQKTIKDLPKKTAVSKHICCSSFRHSFATHLIEEGCDVHIIQELLGHKNLQSTMIYKNLTNYDVTKIVSPLDKLMIN